MITDEEFATAKKAGAALRQQGHVTAARYDEKAGSFVLNLHDGTELTVPAASLEGLQGASPQALSEVEVTPSGLGLHWPALDADVYVPALLENTFQSRPSTVPGSSASSGETWATEHAVRERDPIEAYRPATLTGREISPYVERMRVLWQDMREDVISIFPAAPGPVTNNAAYLKRIDDLYAEDAYHSLSIEGYTVNADLLRRTSSERWSPDANESERDRRNTFAARGYWQAFQAVRQSIERVLDGANPGTVARQDHGTWYRELFAPSITAGTLRPGDLAGYRTGPVYIRGSMHVPPNRDAVRDLMPALFDLLEQEAEPSVRAVLGHFMFVFTHPYMDGNGRTGRFLMNTMLASGGYAWAVVPVETRDEYFAALESASVDHDIKPFARHIGKLLSG